MIDYVKYQNPDKFPTRDEFVFDAIIISPFGKKMKITVYDSESHRDCQVAYVTKSTDLETQFKEAVFRELGIYGHPKSNKAWLFATQNCEKGNYAKIHQMMRELRCLLIDNDDNNIER